LSKNNILTNKTILHYIALTNEFLTSEFTLLKYRVDKKDFTRKRKLSFDGLALCMLKLLRQNIQLELISFFDKASTTLSNAVSSYTSSAFVQSRKKLKPDLFYDLSALIANDFYVDNDKAVLLYKGHRLIGVDGSTINLPVNKNTIKAFGTFNNQTKSNDVVIGRVSIMYDLLNEIVLDGILCNYNVGEVSLSRQHIKLAQVNDIIIMDRAYPSFETMFEMESREIQFIFRCKTSFNNQVSKFYLSNKKQETIIIKPAQNNSIKGLPYDKNATIKVRMIKIELPTGEIEILMTSLKDIEKYPYKDFKELYFKRWGIETFYNRFKNIIGVEQFSGKSEQFILQEFNCALYISNLQSLLTKEVQQEIEQKYADRKYEYKVNSSMSLSIIRSKMLALFTDQKNNQETLNQLKELFVKNVIPIRPDRNFERKTDKYRSRTKPKQFSNRRTVL
jgi:hypothetical protein